MSNEDAQEEANHQNVFRPACIGAKEGIAKEITNRVGKALQTPSCGTRTAFA